MLGCVRTTLITLHGFTMNANGLGHMLAELEPRLAESVDVVHVNAPHVASEDSVAGLASVLGGFRPKPPNLQWWNASDDGRDYHGWAETRARIAAEVERHGAAGLLGFSQGAAVAAALAAASSLEQFPPLRFVVLVAGFTPRAQDIAPLFSEPVRVPSLHVWGEADHRFAKHSPSLVERFEPATREVHTWPGRHVVPTSGAAGDAIVDFVRRHSIGPGATGAPGTPAV
jgi:predicted esterase